MCWVDYDKAEAMLEDFRRFLYQPLEEMEEFKEDYIRMGHLQGEL